MIAEGESHENKQQPSPRVYTDLPIMKKTLLWCDHSSSLLTNYLTNRYYVLVYRGAITIVQEDWIIIINGEEGHQVSF